MEAVELWVDRFFQKPFDPAVLVAASRADLDKMRMRLKLRNSYLSFIKEENFEGFVTAAMMHEINNMLNIGNFSAVQLRQRFEKFIPDPAIAKAINRIEAVFARMQGVTSLLNRALRDHDVQPETIKITGVLRHVLGEAQSRFHDCEFEFTNDCSDTQEIQAIPFFPQIILVNLVKNAYEAQTESPFSIGISVKREGKAVVFRVANKGSIPESIVAKIFDPFFTTKREEGRTGMGIGLAIARNLVQESNGTLELESAKDKTVFRVSFPSVD
jgi:signal transduction histidine kinase